MTINLERSLDISTESAMGGGNQAGIMGQGLEEPDSTRYYEEPRIHLPAPSEKVKSHSIHQVVKENNVNQLIEECVKYLKDTTPLGKQIIKYCRANYFADINYKSDIDAVASKIESVKAEERKWDAEYARLVGECDVSVKEVAAPSLPEAPALDRESLVEEFQKKAEVLKNLEGRMRHFFENSKAKCGDLLKNIFAAVEDKAVDPIFLLKAMTKLGQ